MPTLIFGTVNGVIGVIASLPKEEYEYMLKVQNALNQVRLLSCIECRCLCGAVHHGKAPSESKDGEEGVGFDSGWCETATQLRWVCRAECV